MTSQNSSRKPRYSPFSYFAFMLRQNWPAFVTHLIVFLIFDVAVLAMVLTNSRTVRMPLAAERVVEIAQSMRVVQVIVSGFCAVFCGCSAMNYLNSKISVQFYHSIPVPRGILYLNEFTVKAICFLVPKTLGTALSCLVSGTITGCWSSSAAASYFSGYGMAVLYFFLFQAIIFFAASFTGTAFARIVVSGLIVFLPAALVLCVYSVLSMSAVYASYDWLSGTALRILTPVRAVQLAAGIESAADSHVIALSALSAVVFFLAGGVIYGKRKSEASGTPVLSAAAGTVIKYSCMFCAATLGGFAFHLFIETPLSFCVGAVTGALLCMMLMNVILTKTSRRMFAGVVGLGVFCALYIAFFLLFGLDMVGLDRHIPSPGSVSAVTVTPGYGNGTAVRITDPEEIQEICAAAKEYMDSPENTQESAMYYTPRTEAVLASYSAEYEALADRMSWDLLSRADCEMRVTVTFTPKFGVRTEKTLRGDRTVFAALLRAVADSGEFADAYFCDADAHLAVNSIRDVRGEEEVLLIEDAAAQIRQMRAEFTGWSYFQRPSIRQLYVVEKPEGRGSVEYLYPIYDTPEAEWEAYCAQIEFVVTANRATGELHVWKDPGDIRTICRNAALLYDSFTSPYTEIDADYSLAVVFKTDNAEEPEYRDYVIGGFLAGCVPDFVRS